MVTYAGLHGKWLLLLFDFNQTRSLLPNFAADAKYEMSRKSVRWGGRSVAPGRTEMTKLTHCGRVTQICVFNTVKLGTSASSP